MNGLFMAYLAKTARLCIFFGWRVTEVHTDGMKFTDKGKTSIQLSPYMCVV
jgi:hypothetical protein